MTEPQNANPSSDNKLIPEWSVAGDNQIVLLGLLVVVLLLAGLGLFSCASGDSPSGAVIGTADQNGAGADTVDSLVDETVVVAETTTTQAPTTVAETVASTEPEPEPEPETTVAEVDLTGDVSAAVAPFTGVVGVADGTTAVLTGYVDSPAQSEEAEAAAAAVAGIESVDNQLVPVDAGALGALSDNGVSDAVVLVSDLEVTASGTLPAESGRQAAIDAVAAVPGVTSVVDELVVDSSLYDDLNALMESEPIQFATSSAQVLAESDETLDKAAAIILADTGSDVVEVQGYTDIRGSAEANLELSDNRAAAVVEALIERDVPADRLVSKGYGGTTQFAEGDTAEAYYANRRVVFAAAE